MRSNRNTFASLASALSCVTKTLFGAFQLYWPPHAVHHQLRCFSRSPLETHQMKSSSGNRWAVGWEPTHDSVKTPCPSTGTMIRLTKSVIFCIICCAIFIRKSSSCFACSQLSFSVAIVQGLNSSLSNSSDQSSARPVLIGYRTVMPASRNNASSSLCDVSFSHSLPRPVASAADVLEGFPPNFLLHCRQQPALRRDGFLQLLVVSFLVFLQSRIPPCDCYQCAFSLLDEYKTLLFPPPSHAFFAKTVLIPTTQQTGLQLCEFHNDVLTSSRVVFHNLMRTRSLGFQE